MKNAEALEAIADPDFVTELGQFNLEINVAPRRLAGGGMSGFETERPRQPQRRRGEGPSRSAPTWCMVGILPTLQTEHMQPDTLSANPRYRLLNDQIFAARGEDLEIAIQGVDRLRVTSDSIMPEAACTSMQLHLQVSPDDFPTYWNASQAIAGIQLAVGANSPFLFGKELWAETRIALFEQATDTRSEELKAQGVRPRVWFGERWITSIFDLFEENVRYFPALLPITDDEDPVAVLDGGDTPAAAASCGCTTAPSTAGTGRSTTSSRGVPHLRVENRVLPAGPDRRRHDGQRRLLLRPGPLAGRGRAAAVVADVVQCRRGELPRRRPRRHRRPGLLAGRRHGVGAPSWSLRRLLPRAAEGLDAWGLDSGGARPAARHHRAALPDRPQRRDLADGDVPPAVRLRARWTGSTRCARWYAATPSTCTRTFRCTSGRSTEHARASTVRASSRQRKPVRDEEQPWA